MLPEGRTDEIMGGLEAAQVMREVAQAIEKDIAAGACNWPSVIGLWLTREAALADERYAHLRGANVPEEAAEFLAVDDMGYQMAEQIVNTVIGLK